MRKIVLLLMLFAVVFSQGCCTIFLKDQDVSVASTPAGAKVEMGPYEGTTPYTVSVPRGKSYTIQATYGGERQTQNLEKSIEPLWFVNILFWPGLIVDLATGKMWQYDPTTYNFNFASNR